MAQMLELSKSFTMCCNYAPWSQGKHIENEWKNRSFLQRNKTTKKNLMEILEVKKYKIEKLTIYELNSIVKT